MDSFVSLGGLVFLISKGAIHEVLAGLIVGVGLVLISLEVILHRLLGGLKDVKGVLRQMQGVLDASDAYHTNIDQNIARLVTAVEGRDQHNVNVPPVINSDAVNADRTDGDEPPE